MTSGFKTEAGKKEAKLAPPTAAKKTNGKSLPTIFKSTLPERINLIALVKEPNELASLFVPSAVAGGRPMASRAGVDIKPPPPTTASINAAKNPNTIMINISVKSHSTMFSPFYSHIT